MVFCLTRYPWRHSDRPTRSACRMSYSCPCHLHEHQGKAGLLAFTVSRRAYTTRFAASACTTFWITLSSREQSQETLGPSDCKRCHTDADVPLLPWHQVHVKYGGPDWSGAGDALQEQHALLIPVTPPHSQWSLAQRSAIVTAQASSQTPPQNKKAH